MGTKRIHVVDGEAFNPADIDHLASNLHPSDVRECVATGGSSPAEMIHYAITRSTRSWGATDADTGEPIAVFGVGAGSVLAREGVPWLLRSRDAKLYQREYIRLTHQYLEQMLQLHPVLRNFCGAWAHDSVRWLMRTGFVVGPAVPVGINGEMMRSFELSVRRY